MPTARRLMIGKHDCPDDVIKDDYDSLVQIYNLLHGSTWANHKGWLIDCSCGKWVNVVVKNRRVVTLFSNYNVYHTPGDITGWVLPTGLEVLDFKWVKAGATGDISSWILPTTLKKLDISSLSGITSDISSWVLPSKLEIINLTNAHATGDIGGWVLPQTLINFSLIYAKTSGDVGSWVLPPKLTTLDFTVAKNMSGDVTGWILPPELITFVIHETKMFANVSSWILPPKLERFAISNIKTTGDISSFVLPSTLTSVRISGTNISGSIDSWVLPASLRVLGIVGPQTGKVAGAGISGIPDMSSAVNIETIDLRDNNLSQSNVDGILAAVYATRNTHVKSGKVPRLNLSGVSNAVPDGIFQASATPSTGKEYAYALINDPNGEGFKKWTVTTN